MKIFKYVLQIEDEQICKMPKAAKIISVQMQGESLCLWALTCPTIKLDERRIRIVGTGSPFHDADQCQFIGTVQDRQFVWHVFEKAC